MGPELLLLGTTGEAIRIDPDRVSRVLENEPAVRADLQRLDLATPTQIVGMFVGSAATLARATANVPAVSDDRPLQEYVVRSAGAVAGGVPASLFDFASLASWCPRCFDGNHPASSVPGLDAYVAVLDKSYRATGAGSAPSSSVTGPRLILGSRYLGAVVPDTDAVYDVIGVTLLRKQQYAEAIASFSEALARSADSVDANRHMATALAESGHAADAVPYLRHAVQIDPGNGAAQYELGRLLLDGRQFREAAQHFLSALRSMPESSSLHNDLGVALASIGDLRQAVEHFRQAVSLDPAFVEARRNLESAERAEREGS
jgi:tetratricopeptide (TPR) repeat protein